MKKVFVLWTVFIPLLAASNNPWVPAFDERSEKYVSTLSVVSTSRTTSVGEYIENWKFDGNFDHLHDSGTDLNRIFMIRPTFKASVIRYVVLAGYVKNPYTIYVFIKDKIDCPIEFTQKFADKTDHTCFLAKKSQDFSELLAFFYQKQYLPDCIINLILKKFAHQKIIIQDFRSIPQN